MKWKLRSLAALHQLLNPESKKKRLDAELIHVRMIVLNPHATTEIITTPLKIAIVKDIASLIKEKIKNSQ